MIRNLIRADQILGKLARSGEQFKTKQDLWTYYLSEMPFKILVSASIVIIYALIITLAAQIPQPTIARLLSIASAILLFSAGYLVLPNLNHFPFLFGFVYLNGILAPAFVAADLGLIPLEILPIFSFRIVGMTLGMMMALSIFKPLVDAIAHAFNDPPAPTWGSPRWARSMARLIRRQQRKAIKRAKSG